MRVVPRAPGGADEAFDDLIADLGPGAGVEHGAQRRPGLMAARVGSGELLEQRRAQGGRDVGQEAVARVHNLGRPPRRLALAHLDGAAGVLPAHGDEVLLAERVVGWIGTAAQHHELGPVATVVVKRAADPGADLLIRAADGDVLATQEIVVVP